MKRIIILIIGLIIILTSIKSQSVDSIVTYMEDSVLFKSKYQRNLETNKTEVFFYKGNTPLPYAKWLYDNDTNEMSYFREDTIYFKTVSEDLGDIIIKYNYYLEDDIWELQWSTIYYYSMLPTYNVEIPNTSELLVYQNGKESVLVRLVNPDELLDDIIVYDINGRVIDKYSNIKMNKVRLNISVKGLFIVHATIVNSIDELDSKKIIIK